jgi:nucleoside-diphosphate-sugar epimerase
MTVLITGGSGFVGMAIAEALLADGHHVALFAPEASRFNALLAGESLCFVGGDVRSPTDLAQVRDLGITHLIHGAALTPDAAMAATQEALVTDVNVNGSRRVMELAAEIRPERVIQLSSIAVYGDAATNGRGRFSEDISVPNPQSLYGRTKLAAEQAMREMSGASGIALTTIRLGPIFGPWEFPSESRSVASPHFQVVRSAMTSRPCILPRPIVADWTYSAELGRKVVALMGLDRIEPSIVNLSAGYATSVEQWCTAIQSLVPDFEWRIDEQASTIRFNYANDRPILDTQRLDALVPAQPRAALAELAADYLEWAAKALPGDVKDIAS